MLALAVGFPELRRNCLYSAEEHDAGLCLWWKLDVEVFDSEAVRNYASPLHWTRSVWFTPMLF